MTLAPRPTLFITSPRLDRHVGLDVTLASETLQHTGSFKFRAAFNNAAQRKAAHLIATSSGNFGQALAYACQLHGKRCTVIMPNDASPAKVRAVRTYGAEVGWCARSGDCMRTQPYSPPSRSSPTTSRSPFVQASVSHSPPSRRRWPTAYAGSASVRPTGRSFGTVAPV